MQSQLDWQLIFFKFKITVFNDRDGAPRIYAWGVTAFWMSELFFLYNNNNLTLKLRENNVGGQTTKEPYTCGKYCHLLVTLCNWQIPCLVQLVSQT